jgi:glycosyltransferase involved in cell wall biosynthesis
MMATARSAGSLERLRARVGAVVARLAIVGSYAAILSIARLASLRPRSRPPLIRRLLVTGTFHNEGWYLAHLRPLALSGFDEVIVVTEVPHTPIEGVRCVCPPSWFSGSFGRAALKGVWMLAAGLRYRPTLCMGYHLFPGSMTALLIGRLLGVGTCYQQTGGAAELLGGGYASENPLIRRLGGASTTVERLALALVREFDRVVVRGESSRRFLAERGVDRRVEAITGSIFSRTPTPLVERPYDLLFVGRLIAQKRPTVFVEIVEAVKASVPGVTALVIGRGAERGAMENRIAERGLGDHISLLGARDDVGDWMLRSKVLVQPSLIEGLPIVVAEAMGCGTPVVVSDVGDLADLVENGVNGWRVDPFDVAAYAERVTQILRDEEAWARLSERAVEASRALTSLDEVAARWRRCLSPWTSAEFLKPTSS